MNKIVKHSFSLTVTLSTGLFALVPEEVFGGWSVLKKMADTITIVWAPSPLSSEEMAATLVRLTCLIIIFFCALIAYKIKFSKSITLNKNAYFIRVQYEDLLKQERWKRKKCLKVIPFNECFTTSVGFASGKIKPNSLFGQYLRIIR